MTKISQSNKIVVTTLKIQLNRKVSNINDEIEQLKSLCENLVNDIDNDNITNKDLTNLVELVTK